MKEIRKISTDGFRKAPKGSGWSERMPDRAVTRGVYEAAAEVFLLPDFDDVIAWIEGGPEPEFLGGHDPHTGTSHALLRNRHGAYGAIIITDGGREVRVEAWPRRAGDFPECVTIDFGASLAAAGEVIHHLWNGPLAGFDNFASIEFVDGTKMDADDYEGPVHRELGRSRWDYKWRKEYPGLAAAVPVFQVY